MKIAITGATGAVGQRLVPLLQRTTGVELVLVGRDVGKVRRIFPEIYCCNYDDLAANIRNFDALVHLAVLNNNCDENSREFHQINAVLLQDVLEKSNIACVKYFVNITTLHALDENNQSKYAVSKRNALLLMKDISPIKKINYFLPLVYSDTWSGRLKALECLPKFLSLCIFGILSALKPVVHVKRIYDKLLTLDANSDVFDEIVTDGQSENIFFSVVKRFVDLAFVGFVIIALWWLFLIVWAAVRIETEGPGIFAQERVGIRASTFTCYKFRTMKLGTAQVGTHDASTDSITKIGKFLRRTKIDELPQVWNILRNEMSLIGPRPCLPLQFDLIQERKRQGVFDVKPGITGLAQVNDIDMSNPVKLAQWDSQYIKLQSLVSDVKILLLTFTGRGSGDRVTKLPS